VFVPPVAAIGDPFRPRGDPQNMNYFGLALLHVINADQRQPTRRRRRTDRSTW
jgi:hypothetical protein